MTNLIIERINQFALDFPQQRCFESLEGDVLTYQELAQESTALAHYFLANYPQKQPVVVYGGLTKEMVITFVACLKSGRPYIPIDQDTPSERVEAIISAGKPSLIVAFSEWSSADVAVLKQEQFNEIVAQPAVSETDSRDWVQGDDLLYIIFTSGTTGQPKGVQISYNNLISFTTWIEKDFALSGPQRFLCQAPFSFDLSVMDLYPSLLSGGTLVPVAKKVAENFPLLFETIPQLEVNVWVSTPSLVEICLLDPNFNGDNLASFSHFLFCGEELPRPVAEKLLERFPTAKVFNTYGPTEATVAVTAVEITAEILANYDRLPLGYVKSDTRIVILNDERQAVAPGEVGEVVIVGPSVSQGYLHQPEKTAEVFFDYDGQPAYGTGDAGYLKNDLLFYQGRLDFQIKWHGYRIELGDIEHHLLALDEVRNVCVVAKYKDHKVQQLVAFVALEAGLPENKREKMKALKEQLAGNLMSYMIPQKFNFVESLDLTPNGKIDRKKLMNEVNG